MGMESFGRQWQSGDVVGCMIDLTEMNIMFTLNGEMLISDSGSEMAFKDIDTGEGKERVYTVHFQVWTYLFLIAKLLCVSLNYRLHTGVQSGSVPGRQDQLGPECQQSSLLYHLWLARGI